MDDALIREFTSLFLTPTRVKKKASEWIFAFSSIGSTQPSNPVQKCDAKRPCTTCIGAGSASGCIYDNETRPEPREIYPSSSTAGHLSGVVPVEALVTVADLLADLPPSTSGATRILTCESPALQVLEADRVLPGRPSKLVPVHRSSSERHLSLDTNEPSISIITSFLLPRIPPEPWIPLSFLGEERLQVSDAATTDLDMRWCVF